MISLLNLFRSHPDKAQQPQSQQGLRSWQPASSHRRDLIKRQPSTPGSCLALGILAGRLCCFCRLDDTSLAWFSRVTRHSRPQPSASPLTLCMLVTSCHQGLLSSRGISIAASPDETGLSRMHDYFVVDDKPPSFPYSSKVVKATIANGENRLFL